MHTAPWLRDKDIAAIATDTWGIEVLPNEIDVWQPLHVVSLAHTGLAFGEMFGRGALSEDSKSDGIYEFMFSASPLPVTGASGGPVSALAINESRPTLGQPSGPIASSSTMMESWVVSSCGLITCAQSRTRRWRPASVVARALRWGSGRRWSA